MARVYGTIVAFALCMAGSGAGWAQRATSNWPAPPPSAQQMPGHNPSKSTNLEQLQRAAEQHKEQVQKDTARLSELVTELKQELDKTPAGTLSVDAVKKSKEIEKLAKRVRKDMQGD